MRMNGNSDISMLPSAPPMPWANAGEMNIKYPFRLRPARWPLDLGSSFAQNSRGI
jgi:hypothetical protein